MENTTGNTFEALIEWLMDQEDTMSHITIDHPEYYSRYDYRNTRLHLKDHTARWRVNGDEYVVLRMLIYSIHRANIFDNIMKVLCDSPELEDRMLAIILHSSSPEFRKIGEKIVNYLSDEQRRTMALKLIAAIKKAE